MFFFITNNILQTGEHISGLWNTDPSIFFSRLFFYYTVVVIWKAISTTSNTGLQIFLLVELLHLSVHHSPSNFWVQGLVCTGKRVKEKTWLLGSSHSSGQGRDPVVLYPGAWYGLGVRQGDCPAGAGYTRRSCGRGRGKNWKHCQGRGMGMWGGFHRVTGGHLWVIGDCWKYSSGHQWEE